MTQLFPIRKKPELSPYKKGDVLVLFGELFNRGYANGLVEEAQKQGMTIIYATVGRRDKDGTLRALNQEELNNAPKPLINVPLEAGFDMELDDQGCTPCDQLKEVKTTEWEKARIDWSSIEQSQKNATARFRKNTEAFIKELESHIPQGASVLFAHLMAGGVPRAKILMPILNRAFKGQGERHISTERLMSTDIGNLCLKNFNEVTAETFRHLLDLSTALRENVKKQGGRVTYTAYGYHGTEVLINGKYQWQTYTCYFQGWAKMALEKISEEYFSKGVHSCVYNCPEILTNSSSVFQGVEVSLYPLLSAIEKFCPNKHYGQKVLSECKQLLKAEITIEQVTKKIDSYMASELVMSYSDFSKWPLHSKQDQMDYMLQTSDYLYDCHKDMKNLITAVLSEVVFKSCGYIMLHDSWEPKSPVAWIGHEAVVNCM